MPAPYAILLLEDGRCFEGISIGAQGPAFGEIVFNTSMTGYQEIITDPSYCGQLVAFTAAHIGNYGVTGADAQSDRPALGGVVMRELSPVVSSWRASHGLPDLLTRFGLAGIAGVDTRALTRHLRERGAMRAGIFLASAATEAQLEQVRASPSLEGRDLTAEVSTARAYQVEAQPRPLHRAVLLDFGVKRGILDSLSRRGIALEVLPATSTAEQVRALRPEALVLSNGPGDPAAVRTGIATARALIGELPILGICLGHQILALALGAQTYKLRFGHHGGNHPVRDQSTGEVWITAQNHGFAVDPGTLTADDIEVTHTSLYDGTLEGFASRRRRVLAVQFHPEACPGPSDAGVVFDRFVAMLEEPR